MPGGSSQITRQVRINLADSEKGHIKPKTSLSKLDIAKNRVLRSIGIEPENELLRAAEEAERASLAGPANPVMLEASKTEGRETEGAQCQSVRALLALRPSNWCSYSPSANISSPNKDSTQT